MQWNVIYRRAAPLTREGVARRRERAASRIVGGSSGESESSEDRRPRTVSGIGIGTVGIGGGGIGSVGLSAASEEGRRKEEHGPRPTPMSRQRHNGQRALRRASSSSRRRRTHSSATHDAPRRAPPVRSSSALSPRGGARSRSDDATSTASACPPTGACTTSHARSLVGRGVGGGAAAVRRLLLLAARRARAAPPAAAAAPAAAGGSSVVRRGDGVGVLRHRTDLAASARTRGIPRISSRSSPTNARSHVVVARAASPPPTPPPRRAAVPAAARAARRPVRAVHVRLAERGRAAVVVGLGAAHPARPLGLRRGHPLGGALDGYPTTAQKDGFVVEMSMR